MAKTPASTLITDLAKRLDLDPTDNVGVRPDMLRQLNVSQAGAVQDHSLRFLNTLIVIALLNNASSAAVPTTIDDGKALALGRASGDGRLEYVPPDEWFTTHLDTYREPTQTEPSFYTVAIVSGVNTFLFKPGNTSGSTLNIPLQAQLLPVAMTDGATFSVLPETWEDTLLLDDAEGRLRRYDGMDGWQDLIADSNDKKERLYSSYRTTKEQPVTSREQEERKTAREKLAPEKP